MTGMQELIDGYINWLRDKTVLRDLEGWVEITTPHLDRHNDCIQIYAKREGSNILLSDDGGTIQDLEFSGCGLDTPKRKAMLEVTLNGFGIERHGDALQVEATPDSFPLKKHNLIQAMLAVNDLFVLSQPSIESFFLEDVGLWLDAHDIRYVPNPRFPGRSGFEHKFDFVIPKSRRSPERLISAINNPRKESAQNAAFAWMDTKDSRPDNSQAFFFLNDAETQISPSVTHALESYAITPVPWSNKEEFIEQLAA